MKWKTSDLGKTNEVKKIGDLLSRAGYCVLHILSNINDRLLDVLIQEAIDGLHDVAEYVIAEEIYKATCELGRSINASPLLNLRLAILEDALVEAILNFLSVHAFHQIPAFGNTDA